jgi:SulP family sulfate permease
LTVGFAAGIAVIIFASQIRDLLGLTLAGKEPGEILPKLAALAQARGTINPVAVALAAASIGLIVGVRRWRPHWPGMLISAGGICDGRGMAAAFALGAEGIQMGTRFVSSAESPVREQWMRSARGEF